MIIICIRCLKVLGEKSPLADGSRALTVCQACYEKAARLEALEALLTAARCGCGGASCAKIVAALDHPSLKELSLHVPTP